MLFDWFIENTNRIPRKEDRVLIEKYANYVTQWHLNNAKEFVADSGYYKTALGQKLWEISDKQSIHTAIDNYIEINLNK